MEKKTPDKEIELPLELKLELDKYDLTIKELNMKAGRNIVDHSYLFVEMNNKLRDAYVKIASLEKRLKKEKEKSK